MDCERIPARILLTGGSGLIGGAFKARLASCGVVPIELAHRARKGAFAWDAVRGEAPPAEALKDIDAVVHLAGAPIARRWTDAVKREIHDSRVNGTRALAEALANLRPDERPSVFVSMSGAAIYGPHRTETRLDEKAVLAKPGESFLADLSREWEAVTHPAARAGIRTINLRTGMVLSRNGGALAMMLPVFKLGLGGPAGPGTQRVSWIGVDDLVALILFALRTTTLAGPVNAVAPHIVTNADFARQLGMALHRPSATRTPEFALRMMFGKMAEETVLSDSAPFPAKAMEAGFSFRHAELPDALNELLRA